MTINNQYELEQEAIRIAKEAMEEQANNHIDASEYIHQTCSGHECVIWTYKAGLLCLECDRHDGQNYLEDMGYELAEPPSYEDHVTKLAYAILAVAAMNAFYDLIESKAA